MDRLLHIGHVHNMSLENVDNNEYPNIVASFLCQGDTVQNYIIVDRSIEVGCAAVQLHHVHNISLKMISLTLQAPNMSGVTLHYASNIHIQLNIVCILTSSFSQSHTSIGIVLIKANIIEVISSHANNCSSGFVLQNTSNIHITNTTATYNMNSSQFFAGGTGISLLSTTNATVMNTSTMHNSFMGMVLEDIDNITVINASVMYNSHHGLLLFNTTRSSIINTTVRHNSDDGICLFHSNEVAIINIDVSYNSAFGIHLFCTTKISITDVSVTHNGYGGMYLANTTTIGLVNTTVMHNGNRGMYSNNTTRVTIKDASGVYVVNSIATSIINVTVMHSSGGGIELMNNSITTINKTTVLHNGYHGMKLVQSTRVSISDTIVMHNGGDGLYLARSTRISIINTNVMYSGSHGMNLVSISRSDIKKAIVMHNVFHGLYLVDANSISITDTLIMYNDRNGIVLIHSIILSIINTTVTHNGYGELSPLNKTTLCLNDNITHDFDDDIYVTKPYKTKMETNTTVLDNYVYDGIYVRDSARSNITKTTVMHNGADGIQLVDTIDTIIHETSVLSNDYHGIALIHTIRSSILNTTVMKNMYGGIFSHETTDARIYDLSVVSNGNEGIILYFANEAHIANVYLKHNGWRREVTTASGDILTTADPTSLPAVIVLYSSSIYVTGCNVTGNNVSAVNAHASSITVNGDLAISDNKAFAGAAFILVHNSFLKLTEHSRIHFRNNHAIHTGGVFYISDNTHRRYPALNPTAYPIIQSTCFLSVEGGRNEKLLLFANNTAEYGGDILYGGHVLYGLDGDWNCLLSFKNISNISQDGLSLISSDPSRVCLCNDDGQPDCLIVADPIPHSIYPGQSITISAVVVGQEFGTVTGSVYAQFLQNTATNGSPQVDTGQRVQFVMHEKCNHLKYTIFSPGDMSEAVLILTIDNRKVSQVVTADAYEDRTDQGLEVIYHVNGPSALSPLKYGHYPLYVNVSFLPCPTGFMLTTKLPFRCDCNQLLQQFNGVRCYIQDQTIGRSGLVWVGTPKNDNGTVVASEYCLFDYCNTGDSNVTLSDPEPQCKYNHSGILCGGCQPGLSLALGSAQCLPCSNKYIALLIPFALAGPVIVFFIKVLDLTISQGRINGLIFYANIVKANENIYFHKSRANPLTVFTAWLNLDLGVETCFFNGLTAYTKTWLQFVFPLYIWSIAGLIIILAKYSDRVAKAMGNNSVPVLATLFLLSYAKLFRTIITALSYTMLYSSQGQKAVWSADGNVDYLGPKHAVLFAVAVAALLFLWLPYTLLLFLGQWLHKCNSRLIDHILMKIKPFLDTHYGPLKGKHHYWYGSLLLVKAAILLMTALIPANHSAIVNLCVSVSAIVLIYFGLIVYQSISVAMFDASFFMNLALLGVSNFFITIVRWEQKVAAYILIGIAFIQFFGLVVFKVLSILKRSKRVMACLRKGQPADDDWELYEQAALLRERESSSDDGTEDEDNTSIESLPTY